MRRLIIAIVLVMISLGIVTPSASAAPAEQVCQPTAFRQHDLAGVYVSAASQMRVEIYACGGSMIIWSNAYGQHVAGYASTSRLTGGGIVVVGHTPDQVTQGYLDNAYATGFKPAEIGYIQVITVDMYGGIIGVYELRKLA